jgi:hypothetical protein
MCMRYGKDVRATAEHLDVALVSISSIENGQVFRRFVDAGFPNPPYLCRALRRMLSLSISKVSPVRSQGPRPVHTAPREGGSGKGEDKDDVGK